MVTLEQVKLLESKVVKALTYIETLSAENVTLREKLDGYRRRIDELETIVLAFKEDQGRIEAGIISALDRLNQFEDAVERGINDVRASAPKTDVARTEDIAPIETSVLEEPPVEAIVEDSAVGELISEQPEELPIDEKSGELDIF